MKILITGATGMLGHALCQALAKHTLLPLSSRDLDIASLPAVRRCFAEFKADWIIHAAAFTNVDKAELHPIDAHRVNALGTRNVAVAAFENRSLLLYYSTDYVFDGRQTRPYREWDPTGPVNEYGRSKLAGESCVRSLCPDHLIVRTSWLFGPNGSHFVSKLLQRSENQTILNVVDDQRGSPTFTVDLAYMTLCLIEAQKRGIYHVSNTGACSWYELAKEILSIKGIHVQVNPVNSAALGAAAPRPPYSVLENYLLKLEQMPLLRPWQHALEAFLRKNTDE